MIDLINIASATFSIRTAPPSADEIRHYDESMLQTENRFGLGINRFKISEENGIELVPESQKQKMERHFADVQAFMDRPAISGIIQMKDRTMPETAELDLQKIWKDISEDKNFLIMPEETILPDIQMHIINLVGLTKAFKISANYLNVCDGKNFSDGTAFVTSIKMSTDDFVSTLKQRGFVVTPIKDIEGFYDISPN